MEAKQEIHIDSYFDGKVIDYIGWKLLSIIIALATLGVAAPWGKCMLYRYQFNLLLVFTDGGYLQRKLIGLFPISTLKMKNIMKKKVFLKKKELNYFG